MEMEMEDGGRVPGTQEWIREPGHAFELEEAGRRYGYGNPGPEEALRLARARADSSRHAFTQEDAEADLAHARMLLWIAASRGDREACGMLAEEIRACAESAQPASAHAYRAFAESWEARALDLSPGQALRAALDADAADELPAPPPSLLPRGRGRVVVPSIGDPKSGEGAAMLKRYGALVGRELPARAGMPAPGAAREAILAEWPWAARAAEHVEGSLQLSRAVISGEPRLRPMLFFGPPGSGKTQLAEKVAGVLGIPAVVIPAGGASDSSSLGAVSRGWSTARPCGPVVAADRHRCCDPAIVVDELDKAAAIDARNGSAAGVLLGMLGSPSAFLDSCLMSEVDLSAMTFMATANAPERMDAALLDRFELIEVGRPRPEDFVTVLANLRRRTAARLGVPEGALPALDADEYGALEGFYGSGRSRSLRELSRAYDFALSQAAARNERAPAPSAMN